MRALILAFAALLSLAGPGLAQTPSTGPLRSELDFSMATLEGAEHAASHLSPPRLLCSEQPGGCARRAGVLTAAGALVGGTAALLYGVAYCLPRSISGGDRCGGTLPLVLVGGGAVAGLVAALASGDCRG